jgi:hypothetical protein
MRNYVLVRSLLFVILLGFIAVSGCTHLFPTAPDTNDNNTPSIQLKSIPADDTLFDPNTVPIRTAYNQSVVEFWRFTLTGPYSTNPDWTSAALDPEPVILYDINGKPQYYEFYLRTGDRIPGYFWTAADRRIGYGISRINEGEPYVNYTQVSMNATTRIQDRFPGFPIISKKAGLNCGMSPHQCTILTIMNTTSGREERVIIDAFTNDIVPEHPSESYAGHEYAWSYLDSIPESEWPDRILQWELGYSNASPVIDYALAQGINPEKPLSVENARIIRTYLSPETAGETRPSATPAMSRPITDKMIQENTVPVETARVEAQAYFWRRAVDRPDIYGSLTYRNATLSTKNPLIIEDIFGRKLFYVFPVERDGEQIHWIVRGANTLLGEWLFMPAEPGDIANATRIASDRAREEFPGEETQSTRIIYCNWAPCSGTRVVLTTYDPSSDTTHRIVVDTWSLNTSVEIPDPARDDVYYSSLFAKVEPDQVSKWTGMWVENHKTAQDFVTYALSHGIVGDRVLGDKEIITLGSYLADTTPQYAPPQELFNPLYPEPVVRPTLDKATQVWHEQADWFSIVGFDADREDQGIEHIIRSHPTPYDYTVRVYSPAIVQEYYIRIPVSEYNATFTLLEKKSRVTIPERITPMGEYIGDVKRDGTTIILPVGILFPIEANVKSLSNQGIIVRPMKHAEINYYSATTANKTEREGILAELLTDSRVLYAMKEYPG